jgi:RNA polymerase sigma-70 factor (ECF subfamily)
LVERARRGDAAAYATLVEAHADAAYQTALAITHEAAEAQDAAQDAFVKAYYALARFQAGAPFRPWLLRIVANEARNRRTAAGRRAALAARAAQIPDTQAALSPESAALDAERRAAVLSAVRRLPGDDQRVIAGRYFLDLSEHEMAAALGIPHGTVKSRLSRALARLRRVMPAVVIALLALAGLAAALIPPVRGAIAGRLGLRGVGIRHVSSVPSPALTPAPVGTAAGAAEPSVAVLGLGEPMTLLEARERVPSLAATPTLPGLGEPDLVYVGREPPGGRLSLVYGARPQVGIGVEESRNEN